MAQYDIQAVPGQDDGPLGGHTVASSSHTLDAGAGIALVVDDAVITDKAMLLDELEKIKQICLSRDFPAV